METAKGNLSILVKTTWYYSTIRKDGNLVYCPMAVTLVIIFFMCGVRPGEGIVKIDIYMVQYFEILMVQYFNSINNHIKLNFRE